MASCENALDIVPKGETTLDNIDDLELLLNQQYNLEPPTYNLSIICNECVLAPYYYLPAVLESISKEKAYLTYDETFDRASQTKSDDRYNDAFKYINYMNVIIDKVPGLDGSDYKKKQLIAEAHIMRAYMHWIILVTNATQYNNAESAAKAGGIPYVTDLNAKEVKAKRSLGEVYNLILKDCSDEYINALPDKHANIFRSDKAWGNAVRAKVLMQMKRYKDALPYALRSLELNGAIEDRSSIVQRQDWVLPRVSDNNLVLIGTTPNPAGETLSKETAALFEPGDYVKDYATETGNPSNPIWSPNYSEWYGGYPGGVQFCGYSTYVNCWGITSDRMYYTAAECYIRTGEYQAGLGLVNKVRKHRIDSQHYADFKASNEKDAMELMQKAKWIECIGTYENFFDCKRWNSEDAYKRTITRSIPEIGTVELNPNSPLWILPFSTTNIYYNPTLTQNY